MEEWLYTWVFDVHNIKQFDAQSAAIFVVDFLGLQCDSLVVAKGDKLVDTIVIDYDFSV